MRNGRSTDAPRLSLSLSLQIRHARSPHLPLPRGPLPPHPRPLPLSHRRLSRCARGTEIPYGATGCLGCP
eukprot:3048972-Rhodomonas_salina.1